MSDDHILLIKVLERHDITVKQLSTWTGYAGITIYKYRDGSKTIPSIIWRVLYKQTRDPRIIELLTGDLPIIVTPLPEPPAVLTGPGGAFDKALDITDDPVVQVFRDAFDILSGTAKAFGELIQDLKKIRGNELDNRKH